MKTHRQAKIKQIIESQVIETQEDLALALRERDIEVTQATVSRDIKDMQLVKIPYSAGKYRYAFQTESKSIHSEGRMKKLFSEMITRVEYSENIVVIHTQPGAASSVCLALDNAKWTEIIGTVAGDDTILAVVKDKILTESVALRLEAVALSKD